MRFKNKIGNKIACQCNADEFEVLVVVLLLPPEANGKIISPIQGSKVTNAVRFLKCESCGRISTFCHSDIQQVGEDDGSLVAVGNN